MWDRIDAPPNICSVAMEKRLLTRSSVLFLTAVWDRGTVACWLCLPHRTCCRLICKQTVTWPCAPSSHRSCLSDCTRELPSCRQRDQSLSSSVCQQLYHIALCNCVLCVCVSETGPFILFKKELVLGLFRTLDGTMANTKLNLKER